MVSQIPCGSVRWAFTKSQPTDFALVAGRDVVRARRSSPTPRNRFRTVAMSRYKIFFQKVCLYSPQTDKGKQTTNQRLLSIVKNLFTSGTVRHLWAPFRHLSDNACSGHCSEWFPPCARFSVVEHVKMLQKWAWPKFLLVFHTNAQKNHIKYSC